MSRFEFGSVSVELESKRKFVRDGNTSSREVFYGSQAKTIGPKLLWMLVVIRLPGGANQLAFLGDGGKYKIAFAHLT